MIKTFILRVTWGGGSAVGPDGIPSSLLVNCATELAPLLLIVFNDSLSSGVVPPSFKLAAITPVFNSGDRTAPSNYRPISLSVCFVECFLLHYAHAWGWWLSRHGAPRLLEGI